MLWRRNDPRFPVYYFRSELGLSTYAELSAPQDIHIGIFRSENGIAQQYLAEYNIQNPSSPANACIIERPNIWATLRITPIRITPKSYNP